MPYLTKTKEKDLARKVASEAHNVKYPTNYQVGEARKVVVSMINANPQKYITFHPKYCTPKEAEIIADASKLANPQDTLFEMEQVKWNN